MPELTTVNRVKHALRIPGAATIHDAGILEIIEEVEDEIREDCYLDSIVATTYTETLDAEPGMQRSFVLPRFPVFSVVALTIAGEGLSTDQYAVHRSGRVRLVTGGLHTPSDRQEIEVTYTAGLVETVGTTPQHLRRWATLKAAMQYNMEPLAGLKERDISPVRERLSVAEEDMMRQELNRIAARYARPSN